MRHGKSGERRHSRRVAFTSVLQRLAATFTTGRKSAKQEDIPVLSWCTAKRAVDPPDQDLPFRYNAFKPMRAHAV